MNIDLNKAMKDCEGIEKVQERTNIWCDSDTCLIENEKLVANL